MTVQLANERAARREVARSKRARTYSGPGFGPRSFECLGVGIGVDIGDGAAAGGTINFTSYFTGGNILQSVQTDLGLTIGTSWIDQGSGGKNYTSATWPTAGSGLNGFPTLLFNGTSQYLSSALNLAAPGTTPTWIGMVLKQVAWTSGRVILGDTPGAGALIWQTGATPAINQNNGANGNSVSTPSIGTWECLEAAFTFGADYLRRGSTTVNTTTSSGNNASTGRFIGAYGTPAGYTNIEVASLIYLSAVPSGGQIAAWRAAVTAKYGGSVAV